MFRTIVLICSVSTPHQDCTPQTAIDIIRSAPARNASMCGLFGQFAIASTAVAPRVGEQYQKIVCERSQ